MSMSTAMSANSIMHLNSSVVSVEGMISNRLVTKQLVAIPKSVYDAMLIVENSMSISNGSEQLEVLK